MYILHIFIDVLYFIYSMDYNYINFRRWNINITILKKDHNHRALSDIKESIKELQYYKSNIFNSYILQDNMKL